MTLPDEPYSNADLWSRARMAVVFPAAFMLGLTVVHALSVAVHAYIDPGVLLTKESQIIGSFELLLYEIPALPLLVVALDATPRSGGRRCAWLLFVPLIMSACLAVGLGATGHSLDLVAPYGCTIAVVFVAMTYRSAARTARAELMRRHCSTAKMDGDLAHVRLRLLQSQLEPHFLFNTLATVQALGRIDRAAAGETLDDFMGYLADAWPGSTRGHRTVADELRLVEAYLRIHGRRMGPRLHYEIRVQERARIAWLPSLLVYGLVDNAIRHGIAPALSGGTLTISAFCVRDALVIQVSNSGLGMTITEGRSLGLASARLRLALLYGEQALLTLNSGKPIGVVVTAVLPFTIAPTAVAGAGTGQPVDATDASAMLHCSVDGSPVVREGCSETLSVEAGRAVTTGVDRREKGWHLHCSTIWQKPNESERRCC